MTATKEQSLAQALATIDAALGGTRKTPAPNPLTREEVAAIRADLDAKFRAGETVMVRNRLGQFNGAVKVATFGGEPVAAELPAYKMAE